MWRARQPISFEERATDVFIDERLHGRGERPDSQVSVPNVLFTLECSLEQTEEGGQTEAVYVVQFGEVTDDNVQHAPKW